MTLIADGAPPTTSFRPMEAHGTGDRPVNDEIPFFDVVLLFSFFPFFLVSRKDIGCNRRWKRALGPFLDVNFMAFFFIAFVTSN